jgi:hypothetical protein
MERLAAMMKAVLHLKVVRMHNEKVFQEETSCEARLDKWSPKKKIRAPEASFFGGVLSFLKGEIRLRKYMNCLCYNYQEAQIEDLSIVKKETNFCKMALGGKAGKVVLVWSGLARACVLIQGEQKRLLGPLGPINILFFPCLVPSFVRRGEVYRHMQLE